MDYSQESDKPEWWTMPKCLTIKGETELFLKYSTVKWQPIFLVKTEDLLHNSVDFQKTGSVVNMPFLFKLN